MTATVSDKAAELGSTAFGVAAARQAESARPDRLFDDPLAARLMGAAGEETRSFWTAGAGARLSAAMGDYVALRTRYFDEQLRAAAAVGCRQVVLVAAGLDTRAARMDWPEGTVVYELDQDLVLSFKAEVLDAEQAAGVAVPVDLRTAWADRLLAAGFRPAEPTAWLIEGLLVYLTVQEADALLAVVSRLSAPGSRLAVEHATRASLDGARSAAGAAAGPAGGAVGLLATLWRNDLTRDPADWLAGHGWTAERTDPAALAVAHGRPAPPVFDPARPGSARISLLSAHR